MSKVKHMIYWKQLLLDCSFCFLEESSTGAAAAAAVLLIVLSSFLSAGRYLEERMNVKEEEFLIYFPSSSTATALLPVSAS